MAASVQRAFGGTRVVVDVFGPLINIEHIAAFAQTDPRYRSEEEIARHPKIQPAHDGTPWTSKMVLDETERYLRDPKLALKLIDHAMCKLLCHISQTMNLAIVSSVPSEPLFEAARLALLKFTESESRPTQPAFHRDWFHRYPKHNADPSGIEAFLRAKPSELYTIVVDDSPPFGLTDTEDLSRGEHYSEWYSGQVAKGALRKRLSTAMRDRIRVATALSVIRDEIGKKDVSLANYNAIDGFVVHDEQRRASIRKQVEKIETVIASETGGKPICVFLGGPPGSGKSHFVERCAVRFGAARKFPTTSLSGVSARRFDRAIERHIEVVYNKPDDAKPSVAFLDEVDTMVNRGLAFRFLMNSMTGKRTDEFGIGMDETKSGTVRGVVWFFAGSAGRTRDDYVRRFARRDRKVRDFFDRIHFYLNLPGIEEAGQAIIQSLQSIGSHEDGKKIQKVHKNVLLLFGATRWTSVRQLNTVARVALAGNNDVKLDLDRFENLGTLKEFHETYERILNDQPFGANEYVAIRWS